jgi:predicted membrane-bound spermidine synthase
MRPSLRWLILVLFLVSGSSALVYQVAWQRLLVLFAGGDVAAMTIIVTAFMAGLGAGSLVGGWLADRASVRMNLVLFAVAELLIGLFGFYSGSFFHDLLYARLAMLVESRVIMALVLFACLLPPTLLMGLSLPVLARALTDCSPALAGRIGGLYAANTLGAGLGALLVTWVLLPLGGIEETLRWAALGNAACALLMLPVIWKSRPSQEASARPSHPGPGQEAPRKITACLVVFFISGFAALAAEMVWLRVLGAMAKSSAHTLGTLLAVYLAGLGAGALWGSRWVLSPHEAWRLFLRIQGLAILFAACGVALILEILTQTPVLTYLGSYEPVDADSAVRLLKSLVQAELGGEDKGKVWLYPLLHLAVPLLVMFPSTFLMGAGFPWMQRAAQTDARRIGWRTGLLQAVNIAGCMAGAAGVCAFLLPAWGSAGVFRMLALLGGALLIAGTRRHGRLAALLATTGLLLLLPGQEHLWARVHGTTAEHIVLAEDGSGVSVLKKGAGDEPVGVYINGVGQSWIPYGGVHTQLGALPVLLHDHPQRVALIGLGSGDTLHAMLARRETEEAWCAEIVTAQVQTLKAIAKEPGMAAVDSLLKESRSRIFDGDGRMMLLRDKTGFDVIEADALRPTSAHSGTLYSQEYFELLKSRLKPGGMAVTWLPTPRVAETMARVFPHLSVFGGMIGIGTVEPLRVDSARLQARLNDTGILAHYQKAGIDLHGLLEPVIGPSARVQSIGPDFDRTLLKSINTDLFPRDEMMLPGLWTEALDEQTLENHR